jgi:hypothetical protein
MKTKFHYGNQAGQAFVQNLPATTGHAIGYAAGFSCGMIVGTGKGLATVTARLIPQSVKAGFRKSKEQPAQTEATPAIPVDACPA